MERNDPGNISFTFDALPTPAMRPGSTWLSYWILGVLCCEGLGQFLWVDGPPVAIPAFIASIPRPLVVGGALGLWQSALLFRWIKGGGDWWLPTALGLILGNFLASRLHPGWTVAAWLPGAALTGFVTGFGQWLILRRTLRRKAGWILFCTCSKIAAMLVASWGILLAGSQLVAVQPELKLVLTRGIALVGLGLTDGWLLGTVLGRLLGPGNRRGPQLRLSV